MHDGKIDEDAGDTIEQQVTSLNGFLRADYVVLAVLCVFCLIERSKSKTPTSTSGLG